MKGQQLYLKVHPYLWEFYRSFYGSEVINVKDHPLLSIRIKNILQTETQTWHHHEWSDFRIIVLNLPYFRTGNKAINITYRKFLDDRRQFLISQELYADFKNALHNFTLAYVLAGGSQADGIRDFCTFYNLEMNQVKTDSLKKSWDRCKLKEKWNKERKMLKKVKTKGKCVDNLSPGSAAKHKKLHRGNYLDLYTRFDFWHHLIANCTFFHVGSGVPMHEKNQ